MSFMIFSAVLVIFGVIGCAHPLDKRQDDGPWNLYAYGTHLDGLPIFYAAGQAQIDDMSLSNATNKFPVSLTFGNNQNTWVAHPETTTTTNRTITFPTAGVSSSTNLLGLMNTGSVVCPALFTTPNGQSNRNSVAALNTTGSSLPQTNVWTLYGKYVIPSQSNVEFYPQPTGGNGWYILLWSATTDAALQNIPVTLRTIGPSTG